VLADLQLNLLFQKIADEACDSCVEATCDEHPISLDCDAVAAAANYPKLNPAASIFK
jgi:hypothetical protein